ncbi:TetR/AcrR family transcriptional regulator [Saccharopolyspora rectivirgula]|uniref:TetR/AcrR family transcriptional regulator n=1 Tax=Saccharopolyspora rectivirgula TaxID=28042 RepID=UPI00041BA189|nr:TetR/AcrR family transcriptional regulator [Saccharopolyspora rectivirgula]
MPTSEARPARRRSSERQEQIAAVAAELFCERGYHRVGLGEIAAAVGITGPAIYRHFPSKQAVLAYAVRRFADALVECAERATASQGGPAEELDEVLRSVIRLVVQRRKSVRLYQWEWRNLPVGDRAVLGKSIRALLSTVADLLGRVRPDLSRQSTRLLAFAALSGVASWSTHRTTLADRAAERGLRSLADVVLAASPPDEQQRSREQPQVPVYSQLSRREELIAAALPLFRKRGFHAVSMEEVGAAAGINASAVYRHFTSKADLLAAIYYRAAERLTDITNQALAGVTDAETALEHVVDAYASFAFDNSDLATVYLSENGNLPAPDRHALRRAQRDYVRGWSRLVADVRPGCSRGYVQLLVHGAINLLNDLAMEGGRLGNRTQAAFLAVQVLRNA